MIRTLRSLTSHILDSAIAAVVPHHFSPSKSSFAGCLLTIKEDPAIINTTISEHLTGSWFSVAGKASARMAEAAKAFWAPGSIRDWVITKYGTLRPLSRVQVLRPVIPCRMPPA